MFSRRGVPRPPGLRAAPAALDSVRYGYAPHADGEPDPGEVVWAWLPFEDLPNLGKDRPGVVVGWIGEADDAAIVPLTSQRHGGTVPVGRGRWDRLGRASFAKIDQLYRVPRTEVRREGATLPLPDFERILDRLRA